MIVMRENRRTRKQLFILILIVMMSILNTTCGHIVNNTDETATFNMSKKWSYLTGGQIDSSPAISSDGTLYVVSNDGNLYAINSNGGLNWSYTTTIHVSPVIGIDGKIYTLLTASGNFNLDAINSTGTLAWTFSLGTSSTTAPAIGTDGTIYTSGGYVLYAINPTGGLKWSASTLGSCDSLGGGIGSIYYKCPASAVHLNFYIHLYYQGHRLFEIAI